MSTRSARGLDRPVAVLEVTSPAFGQGQPIPSEHAADGQNLSPPLAWSGSPPGTVEHVVIVDDPLARPRPWANWVVYGIPAAVTSLQAGLPAGRNLAAVRGARQGVNGWVELGWGGPSPPKGAGPRSYHFKVYALSRQVEFMAGGTREELEGAIAPHVIGKGTLIGTYERA